MFHNLKVVAQSHDEDGSGKNDDIYGYGDQQ